MNDSQKQPTSNKNPRRNRKHVGQFLFFLFLGVFILIVGRFSYISIGKKVQNVNLSAAAQQLYTANETLKAKRGTIYDANGQAIAEDTSVYSVYVVLDKRQVGLKGQKLYATNKEKIATVLSKHLPISRKKVLATLNPSSGQPFQVEFGTAGQNISLTTKEKIQAEHLNGVNFVQQEARLYPNGTFASHLVGLAQAQTSKDGQTTLKGSMGIEQAFNQQLTGTNGSQKIKKDMYGYQLPGTKQKVKKAKNGDNVYTTLDTRLQTLLETEMSSVQSQVKANSMNAVLMNAKTGAILAATQRPTFNATTKAGLSQVWRNTLVQDAYEPGSTMKIFTLASSINSGHYNGNATYQSGKYTIGNQTVPDWNTSGWGTITYNKGFAVSSNVAMAHLEQQMGAKTWKKYIKKFHFLQSTNSGLPGELPGSIAFKRPIEQADTSFGQGIQVTVFQMLQGLTAVSNDGKMMKPYVISKVTDPNTNKTVRKYSPKVVGNPISSQTAQEVRKHMEDVVYKSYGIGSDYKMSGQKVAVKTGTAQVSNGSGYLSGDDNYLYSVAAMVPASNPKYVMYITMKQPHLGSKTASQLLASIMKPVMARALQEETEKKTTSTTKMPNVQGKTINAATSSLTKAGATVTTLGSGSKVIKQSVTTGTGLYHDQRIFLLTGGKVTLPSLTGWSKGDVVKLAQLEDLKLTVSGDGYVTKQSLKAGSTLTSGSTLAVTLKQNK
ncbi:cell division protein FtsI [Levilactobacillus senmaizukei DSM 21775 = NBRC 103853]|uniref:Cell division protein FtsI n=1 Tax=Levilactobacillus senmaizukei DSM 21775 = NBRC 103853 TaxID=1423803 RepID=A0A0R2DFN9_9LACO|nr:penicillin-binding transpeptidase domain-containing protein [Levilactobacillus senmaizukei]KRN02864.1 cell division protein FtsI [Levilactobacillus senmaizukei DSM 21775 = NBRC 103853]